MIPADPLFHKPKSIIATKNIIYATIFLGFINLVINTTRASMSGHSITWQLVSVILTLLVMVFLTKQIGLGRKWARTVLLILFVVGIMLTPYTIILLFKDNLVLGLLFVLQAILQILALRYLFSKDSTAWFNRVESNVHK